MVLMIRKIRLDSYKESCCNHRVRGNLIIVLITADFHGSNVGLKTALWRAEPMASVERGANEWISSSEFLSAVRRGPVLLTSTPYRDFSQGDHKTAVSVPSTDLLGGDRPEHSVEMNALHISAAVCSCISLLFLLLALGSDSWIKNLATNIGLWKVCVSLICVTYTMDVVPAYLHATRAFLILGMIAGAVSFGGLCIMFSQSRIGNMSLSLVSCIASFTAALCVMIAMAVFTAKTDFPSQYGWSFGIGWASFPLYLITAQEDRTRRNGWKLYMGTFKFEIRRCFLPWRGAVSQSTEGEGKKCRIQD
ncbi:uncharacterized protein PHA67_002813 isoform 2-T2 [Liasis olivaceus]